MNGSVSNNSTYIGCSKLNPLLSVYVFVEASSVYNLKVISQFSSLFG